MNPIHPFVRRLAALCFTLALAACTGDDGDTDDGASDGSSGASATAGSSSSDQTAGSSGGETSSGGSSGGEASDSSGAEASSSDGSGSDSAADSGSTGAAGLAIAGDWVDDFGGSHAITDGAWTQTYGRDSFGYTIASYDNDVGVVIASSDDDGTWSRFDWSFVGETLWYCQTGFGLPSQQDAEQTPAADASDPESGGCGEFSWSRLTPA